MTLREWLTCVLPMKAPARALLIATLALAAPALLAGCAHVERHTMEVTAYDPGAESCGWERGTFLFWRKYVAAGPRKGQRYTGRTASGIKPHEPRPGLISVDSLVHPWMIPLRLVFFWNILPRKGTIAADTRHYPFGTEIYVPGYGWGVVEDRGGAIKGPARLDVYYGNRDDARDWGRQRLTVKVRPPG